MVAASRKPIWITLGVALALQTLLISYQANRRTDTAFVRVWLLDSLAPAEKLVDMTLYGVVNVWQRYFALIGVHDENLKLKSEVGELRMLLGRQREEVLEAQRLRATLSLSDAGIGKTVVARVIASDPSRTSQTITIDKGRAQGVHPDSAVITPAGVVGRVIYTSNFFSIVQLILDAQSAVGVMVSSTRQQGIVTGTGSRDLELDYIDDDSALKEGDEFLTSGMDRVYPKGLPVGTITAIGPRRGLFRIIRVQPRADFGRLEEVICILEWPEASEPPEFTEDQPR
jgi:rod shape-determining protein MreC